ncbi:hypothetical protein [Chitinolyticbacter meiyuanensis]|uniref:hypothetical protein n=1 Tax=Chitinolyticbacter meiyuanensis TaxID=682798 RepID=UPI0011E5CC98|nr:hypothetical protein [Chitinolyticbacter meiyuanensis]
MISRPTSLAIAKAYTARFSLVSRSHGRSTEKVYRDKIYDFFYANEYEAWFCNLSKSHVSVRGLKEWFMKIHTGESFATATQDWSWEQRRNLGQRYLRDMARDHLRWFDSVKSEGLYAQFYGDDTQHLLRHLELDGYIFRDGDLLQPQSDVLNVEEEKSALERLFISAKLGRANDAFEFLRLGEEHFVAARWSDCISNVRKFFELTLQEGAKALSTSKGQKFDKSIFERPVEVRQYLEREGLFERKERESIDKLYGLLSETGAHPYMAESDQARLLRQLSLTLAQFVLLRLNAALIQA